VQEAAGSPLAAWETFYVIVGSSGAALTGLQFVVIALMAETRRRSSMKEIDAFATPTIVHFGAVLLVSAILTAPWRVLASAGLAVGICGAVGMAYGALVFRRARHQTGYRPVFEDWLWHTALPLISYAALLGAAIALRRHSHASLFVIAGAVVLLLFIGIHNAWDTVTYIALGADGHANPPGDRT
jgi:hypothetical protein